MSALNFTRPEQDLRLDCLKLAASAHPGRSPKEVVEAASAYLAFVSGAPDQSEVRKTLAGERQAELRLLGLEELRYRVAAIEVAMAADEAARARVVRNLQAAYDRLAKAVRNA